MRFLRLVCLLLCICVLSALHPVKAATSDEIRGEINALEQQQSQIRDKITELEQQRNDNLSELGQIMKQKQLLDQQIALINQEILNVEEQLNAMKALIADQQEALDQAGKEYEILNEKFKERIRAMEESGKLTYWSVLFSANNFSDFLDRMNMVQEIAAADSARMAQLRDAAVKVEQEQQALVQQQDKLAETAQELSASQKQLDEKRAESTVLLQKLTANAAEYEALLLEQEAEQARLAQELAEKESAFDRAKYLEWLATQPPVPPAEEDNKSENEDAPEGGTEEDKEEDNNGDTEETPSVPESAETWTVPVSGYTLTSPFGMRLNPTTGQMVMHQGIDMACPEGTPIYASRGGQIEKAEFSDSMGNYVLINHGDGYRSIYMHMTHSVVSAGSYVQAGQLIGYVGNTGASRGNHLHFGVSLNGTYINPYPLLFP